MTGFSTTRIQLAARPNGWPTPADFDTVEVAEAELAPGEVRVRNDFLSVDPYMRGRMNDSRSYVAPYQLGETITGGAVGRVVESADDSLPVGTPVLHGHGWTDGVQAPASAFRPVPEVPGLPLSVHLHMLGMTGLTAYAGLKAVAGLREGDTVFVSGAAGAVGTAVGQIARQLGAGRVIGSAGSAEKVQLLRTRYGYDAAFDYHEGPIADRLAEAAPEGIDVFFDNVGGEQLEAALGAFNDGGRAALCGAIASYNSTEAVEGPRNMRNIITRRLKLQGFTVAQHQDLAAEFGERMAAWLAAGDIVFDETVMEGFDQTIEAFLSMMRGANTGKMIVRLDG